MDDYIAVLLEHIRTQTSHFGREASQARKALQALQALEATFSPEQRQLFLTYEETHNAASAVSEDAYARAAFLLAREIYR